MPSMPVHGEFVNPRKKRSGADSLVRCRQRAAVHVDDSPAHTRRPLLRPGGVRAVVAESLLLKHQLVISGGGRRT